MQIASWLSPKRLDGTRTATVANQFHPFTTLLLKKCVPAASEERCIVGSFPFLVVYPSTQMHFVNPGGFFPSSSFCPINYREDATAYRVSSRGPNNLHVIRKEKPGDLSITAKVWALGYSTSDQPCVRLKLSDSTSVALVPHCASDALSWVFRLSISQEPHTILDAAFESHL